MAGANRSHTPPAQARRRRYASAGYYHSINFRHRPESAVSRLVIRRTLSTSHSHHHQHMPNPSAISQTPALTLIPSLICFPPFPRRRRGKRESVSVPHHYLLANPRPDHSMLEDAFLFLLSCPFSALSFQTSEPLRRIFALLNLFTKEIRLKPSHFSSREHEIGRQFHAIFTKTSPKWPRNHPKPSQKRS